MWYDLNKIGSSCGNTTDSRITKLEQEIMKLRQELQSKPGFAGPQGPKGDRGDIGPTGPVGIAGPIGPAGPVGDRGEKGDPGTSLKVLDRFDSIDRLPQHGQNEGDAYLIGNDLYVWNGQTWVNAGPVKGPQGDRGDRGERGPKGDKGDIGPKGDRGSVGPIGPTGNQGQTGPVGPRGERGLQGERGEQGLPGPSGPAGDRGPTGDRGPQGEKGEPGDPADTSDRFNHPDSHSERVRHANNFKENGYTRTSDSTEGLPAGLNPQSKWGILKFMVENGPTSTRDGSKQAPTHVTGVQQFIPIDGPQQGLMYSRAKNNNGTWQEWKVSGTSDPNTNFCSNIDNTKTTGIYHTKDITTGRFPNSLSGNQKAGILEVNRYDDGTNFIVQRYTQIRDQHTNNRTWTRVLDGGSNWGNWKELGAVVDLTNINNRLDTLNNGKANNSDVYTRQHIDSTFIKNIDFRGSIGGNGDSGYYDMGPYLRIQWKKITGIPWNNWDKIVVFENLRKMYAWNATGLYYNGASQNDINITTYRQGENSIKVRANHGNAQAIVFAIGIK